MNCVVGYPLYTGEETHEQIQHVEQRGDWDCGVACIAMIAGLSYDAALVHVQTEMGSHFKSAANGIQMTRMDTMLAGLGYAVARRRGYHAPFARAHLVHAVCDQQQAKERDGHYVVMGPDGTLHDPCWPTPIAPEQFNWAPVKSFGYRSITWTAGVVRLPTLAKR